MGIRRALWIGSIAVAAAVVGAASSFAFSGAIALNEEAGVQISTSPVTVPAAAGAAGASGTTNHAQAPGRVVVRAPEPRDLAPPPREHADERARDSGSDRGPGSRSVSRHPGKPGDRHGDGEHAHNRGPAGKTHAGSGKIGPQGDRGAAQAKAPGRGQPEGSERDRSDRDRSDDDRSDRDRSVGYRSDGYRSDDDRSDDRSDRDHSDRDSDGDRSDRDRSDRHSSRDTTSGGADRSSDCESPDRGGG